MTYKKILLSVLLITSTTLHNIQAQNYWDKIKEKESTLGLEKGFESYETAHFILKLVKASQTVASLAPKSNPDFDFTPGERLELRSKDGLYQLGDINFRLRNTDSLTWRSYSTAVKRKAVTPVNKEGTLAAANLSATLADDLPLDVIRYYALDKEDLILGFEFKNTTNFNIELGALGVPMVFNNILEGHSLDEAHAKNVFFDPYIGEDAGYLEVKKLDGNDEVLLVLPEENMPFEAYRPLLDDETPRSIVFEGFHEWMPLSKAYADKEWLGVSQWNTPTSVVIKPGETKTFSLKFTLAPSVKEVQQTLIANKVPVAVGIPGYVIPQNVNATLFLNYTAAVTALDVFPKGSLSIKKKEATATGYATYAVKGEQWGRSRLTITYADGKQQTVNYKVIKAEDELVTDFGNFLFDKQWYTDKEDLFNRAPSLISYDYETKRQVTEDSRAWIAGLSDEGGAGSWLGGIMKQLIKPDQQQVAKLEDFIHQTIWGKLQYDTGENKYGVRKSLYYYEPEKMPVGTYSDTINYKTWAAWSKEGADDPGRSYNYPHVVAAYWTMYRLARYHDGLVTQQNWEWYLDQAYETILAMSRLAPYYAQFGQMEGSVFVKVLDDLKREKLTEKTNTLELEMRKRAEHWETLSYPFGSEMPWDSTGQEEVYMWSDYFGYDAKAAVTLNAILAYMPVMPHWAYNGNARRYWDFLYGGKLTRVERQIHHYGSGMNAIPVLDAYRKNPADLHLLKVGYGGLLGSVSNITEDGFGPAAFHSYPSTLEIDYLSGDYGSNFFGYAINTSSYLVKDPGFGWLAFGGNITETDDTLHLELTTAAKNAVFIEPLGLWITLDAGQIEAVTYTKNTQTVELQLAAKDDFTPQAYIHLSEGFTLNYPKEREAYVIPLKNKSTSISIKK
ncbi:DUF5695 domain-containing protein [Leeuwenhoekiella sp. W20_SRS_FM14]|uniref:DUF5695 domain-containing protein n=1 Tax=Leeuwenhoekiella sp. W20_SRS_FM14 TaxID=3240270 RepID=UPI003F973814